MYEAARRLTKNCVRKKAPITFEHLQQLKHVLYDTVKSRLKNLRTLVICLLGFSGFLRFSELINIKYCDLEFHDTFLKVFIEKSKTDVYRDGHSVYIIRCHLPICPVTHFEHYLDSVRHSLGGGGGYLFLELIELVNLINPTP